MFDFVLLNTLFILLPILCYLLYIVHENVIDNNKNLFFEFAVISSIYLITKYSIVFNYNIDIIKVLLIICVIKDKKMLSILISLYFAINNNLLLILEYLIELSLFFTIFKDYKNVYKIIIFTLIEIVCDISFSYNKIDYILMTNSLYSVISYILIIIIEKQENIINIYGTIREIKNEKDIKESLFKITHEIKNPIAVCKGYIDMLDVNNNKQVNKYIPIIKEEIDRTLTLMSDFLNLNKIKVNKEVMDISLLLDDVSDEIEALLHNTNINYIYDIKDEDIYIEGDYDRLKQVLINMIKNSIEAMDKEIGIISLKMIVKSKVIITIEDNGKGINKESLKRIGEPFFTTKEKGTGLGVKLSNEIIELHNGSIKYSSKEKIGTTVKITLPLKK